MHFDKNMTGLRLSIIAFLLALALTGCKGKEEQTPAGAPSTGTAGIQQGGETLPSPGESGPSETPAGTEGGVPGSTAPRIVTLDLSPRLPVTGDRVRAIVKTTGTEENPVSVEYQWSHNDQPVSGDSDTLYLNPAEFKRGDKITLKVVPYNSDRRGTPMTIVFTLADAAPVIKSSTASIMFDGTTYTYQVKASDPDGDPVSFSLVTAPEGMTINQTGHIRWTVPAGVKGQIPVTVSVTDGQGGETLQNFTLEIR